MTYTVADAEAAIARSPESLGQLSMAADLLIELGDPRGEDFAACMDGRLNAEELMRKYPADVSAMYVAAWRMYDADIHLQSICGGPPECRLCSYNAARAESLRLLAEYRKVGVASDADWIADTGGYFPSTPESHASGSVATRWYEQMRETIGPNYDTLTERLALIDAYAAADPDTRKRWADETRALTPTLK